MTHRLRDAIADRPRHNRFRCALVASIILAQGVYACAGGPIRGTATSGATARNAAIQSPLGHATVSASRTLDRVIKDVCSKRIVLLGEDANHGGGGTLTLKAALVTRLIDECGFSAVMFEASLPEFIDLNRAFEADTSSPAHVADAIGGIWSVAQESDVLTSSLFERARRGQVTLAGLDGQIGATNLYAQTALAEELASYLDASRQPTCQSELQRFARWQYDDVSPFVDAVRVRLRGCLTEITAAASGRMRAQRADEAAAMAVAWRRAVEISDPALSRSARFNARENGMHEAFAWQRGRLPDHSKIIVWCATIHAARSLNAVPGYTDFVSLGSYINRDVGQGAAVIAISALGGSYGRGKAPATNVRSPAASLEARAFARDDSSDLAYLGPGDLAKIGSGTAHVIDYSRSIVAAWRDVIDGLLVLREEHPLTIVHEAKPRRDHRPNPAVSAVSRPWLRASLPHGRE